MGFLKRLFGGDDEEMTGPIEIPGEEPYMPGSSLVREDSASPSSSVFGANAPGGPVTAEELALMRAGDKLKAVASYHKRTGVSLIEAKAAVEAALETGYSLPTGASADVRPVPYFNAEEIGLIEAGRVMKAAKKYVERTGATLEEGRVAIARYVDEQAGRE